MKSKLPRWLIALIFGSIPALTVLRLAVGPEGGWADVSLDEWIAVVISFVTAAWGKYSNPEKVIDPSPTRTLRR